MGAVTVSNRVVGPSWGRNKVVEADITWSTSYATGGDTLDPKLLGLRGIREVSSPSHDVKTRKAISTTSTRSGQTVELGGTETAPTLKLYAIPAGTERTAATSSTSIIQRLRFFGY